MRLSARRALQGLNDHLLDPGIAYLAGRPGSRFVIKSFQAIFQKSGAPLADHAQRGTHFARHRFVVEPLGTCQHQSRPPSQERLAARPMSQRLEPSVLFCGQNQRLFGSPGSHLSLLHLRCMPPYLVHLFLGQETSSGQRKNPSPGSRYLHRGVVEC
jgi:hypothetical protein